MTNFSKKIIFLSFFSLGVTSILAQMILIRELITSFFGNELFISLILASWLVSTGVGSIIFKKISFKKNILFWLYLAMPVLISCSFILARLGKLVLGGTSAVPDFFWSAIWAILAVAPTGLILGLQFAALARQMSQLKNQTGQTAVSLGYAVESIGFFACALLFSFYLFQLSSLIIVYLIFCLYLIILLSLTYQDFPSWQQKIFIITLFILFILSILSFKQIKLIDFKLSKLNYLGQNLIASINSKYGVINITQNGEQKNFYYNGQFSNSSQNKYNNELLADLPILISGGAKNILVIGNAFTGLIEELDKYKPDQIIYLELDKTYYEEAVKYLTYSPENKVKNLKLIYQDARKFLNQTHESFDLIIINYSNPLTLAENRYFTKEFFSLAKSKLNQEGIVEIKINTTPNYTFGEQNQLLVIIYQTLRHVLPQVLALPDNEVVFLASPQKINFDFEKVKEKYKAFNLTNQYVFPDYLNWRFNSDRTKNLNSRLAESQPVINYDLKPILFYQQLKIFSRETSQNKLSFWIIALISLVSLIIIAAFKKITNRKLVIASIVPEFCLISFEVILILLFQTMHGILYTQISLIFALTLLGIALGSLIFNGLTRKINEIFLLKLSYFFIFTVFAIPLFLILFNHQVLNYQFTFYLLSALTGLAIGTKFPVINKIYLKGSDNLAAVYGMDLLGGSFGALLAGLVMLPILGAVGSVIVIEILCLIVWIWILISV